MCRHSFVAHSKIKEYCDKMVPLPQKKETQYTVSARRKNKFNKRHQRNGDLRKATSDHKSNASQSCDSDVELMDLDYVINEI